MLGRILAAPFLLLVLVTVGPPGPLPALSEEEGPEVPALFPETYGEGDAINPPWKGMLLPFGPRRLLQDHDEPLGKGRIRASVDAALTWLAAHQCADGRWSAQHFGSWCHGKEVASSLRDSAYLEGVDPGVTGLALLAFLGAGHGPLSDDPYGAHVRRGLAWLVSIQGEDGLIATHSFQRGVHAHAYATLAIVEAFGMSGRPELQHVAQRALDLVANARNPYFAWRYGVKPGDNDTSVTGCCMMPVLAALAINKACVRRGESAPLEVEIEQLDGALAWIGKMTDPDYGRTGYIQRGGPSSRYEQGGGHDAFPTDAFEGCTALGVLIRLWAGAAGDESSRLNEKATGLLLHTLPTWRRGQVDLYAWMYGALALQQVAQRDAGSRRAVDQWFETLAQTLVDAQRKDGDVCAARGSWDPDGAWGWAGGRVYSTAMAALALLAPLRYSDPGDEAKTLAALVEDRDLEPALRVTLLGTLAACDQGSVLRGVLTSLLKQRDADLRRAAAQLVPTLAKPSKSLAKSLARLATGDKSPAVRVAALEALARLGPSATRHGEAFLAALDDAEASVFHAVVQLLWDSQPLAGLAVSRLEQLLDHADIERSTLAASVLYLHTPAHPRARSMLRARIRTDRPVVARALERTLGWSVPPSVQVGDAQIEYALAHDLPAVFEGPLGQRFVLIPPGTFRMGSAEDELERLPDETLHEVTITRPFFLQVAEVTNGRYREKVPEYRAPDFTDTPLDGPGQPVLRVSHVEAVAYADWLTQQSDRWTFRLPTEAEWEYAARAGTTTRFWWGEDESEAATHDDVADAAARRVWPRGFGQFVESTPQWRWFDVDDGHVGTSEAALRPANPWGLRAMHGNVAEWCLDWKGEYPPGAVTDPTGARSGAMRVYRGGSWVGSPQQCRAAMRGLLPAHLQPGAPCAWIGFRLAAEPREAR